MQGGVITKFTNGILPKNGTKFKTHSMLNSTDGIFVGKKYLKNRKSNTICMYRAAVAGHGGDVWWCENEDGTIAVYNYLELEYAE